MTQIIIKNISKDFPNISWWIEDGMIEISYEHGKGIVARAIDEGGIVFERTRCPNFNCAMHYLEEGVKNWCKENNIS